MHSNASASYYPPFPYTGRQNALDFWPKGRAEKSAGTTSVFRLPHAIYLTQKRKHHIATSLSRGQRRQHMLSASASASRKPPIGGVWSLSGLAANALLRSGAQVHPLRPQLPRAAFLLSLLQLSVSRTSRLSNSFQQFCIDQTRKRLLDGYPGYFAFEPGCDIRDA